MKRPNTRVAAAEANRRFSSLLRLVKQGRTFVVTSHGRPVAKIVPVGSEGAGAGRAREVLLTRLRRQPVQRIGRWTRDELYER